MNQYIYAHINPHNNKVFYIGLCYSENDRINDDTKRNDLWEKEVKEIGGFDKVVKKILYKYEDISYSELRSKEYEVAQEYYKIGENYCSLENNTSGENNPNYGNKWTKQQKENLSKKMTGRYVGSKNPNYGNSWNKKQRDHQSKLMHHRYKNGFINGRAKRVRLFIPNEDPIEFRQKKDMIAYQDDRFGCAFTMNYPANRVYLHPPKGKEALMGQYYEVI